MLLLIGQRFGHVQTSTGAEAAAHGRCWFTSMTMDKGASNGANGGYCAHPCALVAVEPRLHHDQLTAYHLAVVQHGAVLQLALEQHGSCRHEGCFTLLICSLLLGYLNWGRGSQGRISSASFCRGRSFAVQNGSEHFNAAAAGQASCRGVLVRGCSLLPPRRLIPGLLDIGSRSCREGSNAARTDGSALAD